MDASSPSHLHPALSSVPPRVRISAVFPASMWEGAVVHPCVALQSMAHCIFPWRPWRGETAGLLPQSILMLIYQTWSLPRHTTLPMFPGPWGAISGVEPMQWWELPKKKHIYSSLSRPWFFWVEELNKLTQQRHADIIRRRKSQKGLEIVGWLVTGKSYYSQENIKFLQKKKASYVLPFHSCSLRPAIDDETAQIWFPSHLSFYFRAIIQVDLLNLLVSDAGTQMMC